MRTTHTGHTDQAWGPRAARRAKLWRLGYFSLSMAGMSLGCRSDTAGPALLADAQVYARLVLSHRAITLALTAPYDTLQLTTTPIAFTGAVLSDTGTTTYTSSDPAVVTVSPTGLLTSVRTGSNVIIEARRTVNGITLQNSAFVNVNAPASIPILTTLTIRPFAGDSAILGWSDLSALFGKDLNLQVLDQQGASIPNVAVAFSVADPTIVRFHNVSTPFLYAGRPGATTLYSEATVYGVTLRDSLHYAVGYPTQQGVKVLPKYVAGRTMPIGYFHPGTITVNVGAMVVWYSDLPNGQPMDVVFDDPAAAQREDSADFSNTFYGGFTWYGNVMTAVIPNENGGNIAPFTKDSVCVTPGSFADCFYGYLGRARKFTAVGTYPYHSTLSGAQGVIHVVNNP